MVHSPKKVKNYSGICVGATKGASTGVTPLSGTSLKAESFVNTLRSGPPRLYLKRRNFLLLFRERRFLRVLFFLTLLLGFFVFAFLVLAKTFRTPNNPNKNKKTKHFKNKKRKNSLRVTVPHK